MRSSFTATRRGASLPPWALTNSRRVNPDEATQRDNSVTVAISRRGERANVPGHFPVWPCDEAYDSVGSTATPARLEASWHSAVAITASVEVGRCGPCCSIAPTGSRRCDSPRWGPIYAGSQRFAPMEWRKPATKASHSHCFAIRWAERIRFGQGTTSRVIPLVELGVEDGLETHGT